jgi:hypothetical protein
MNWFNMYSDFFVLKKSPLFLHIQRIFLGPEILE